MSRFTIDIPQNKKESKKPKGKTAVYGFDRVTGYFFQVIDEDNNFLINECSLFSKMPNSRMIELMQEYGADENHIFDVAMDLPI